MITTMWRLARRAVVYELGMWKSLYRWILRRPEQRSQGTIAFGSSARVTPVYIAFIVVSAIEIPVVHLVVPWDELRFAADDVSGLVAAARQYLAARTSTA